jgi:hypothetical protein
MADQGVILVDKTVIKLKDIDEPVCSLDGFLTSFKVVATGVKYVHLVENDVIKKDLAMFQNKISKGYYPENSFLEYRKTGDISKLGEKYRFFVSAEIGDIINVKKISLFSPFDHTKFGNWECYTLTYSGQSLVSLGKIIQPPIPFEPVIKSMYLNTIAKEFYKKNIHHNSGATTDKEKYERALAIAKIAIYIHNINAVLFPLFTESELVILKNSQNTYWQTDVFGNDTSYSDITKYFNSIYNFFRGAYLNQKKIAEAKGYEKVYWLALGLSSNALQSFTPLNKIALLSWMQFNVKMGQKWLFLNDNEGLVIKIINSITEDQADLFLEQLFLYSNTNRDNLFDRLADEKGFLNNNAIDDSTFGIGEDNKYNFIMALYLVWQTSSYNPYQNDAYSESNLNHFTYNHMFGCNPDISNSIITEIFNLNPNRLNFSAKPISLNYQSTSSGGYFIDNFYFRSTNISGDKNIAHIDNIGTDIDDFVNLGEAPQNKVLAFQKEYRKDGKDGLYGTYDYLQPVSLIDTNQSASVKIAVVNSTGGTNADVNNLIPIFVLKYIDDRNLSSNIETTVGYLIDIASLYFGGTALVSKFRYIRSVSGFSDAIIGGSEHGIGVVVRLYIAFGTEAINFTAASLSLYCKILTNPSNVGKPWLINMKETLMWIEIFSGVGSMVAENMLRKKTKKLVDDFNSNNNWPEEFTTDPRGVEAQIALQKISGITADLANFTTDAINRLEKKFNLDYKNFDRALYSTSEKQQLIAIGYSKGLSSDEVSGIIHQASRKRPVTIIEPISELKTRMVNFLERKRLRCPFTHPTRTSFESYNNIYIDPTIKKFGLPNYNKSFGGSAVTSPTSFTPGSVQDTDWTVYWIKEEEVFEFLNKQKELYKRKGVIEGSTKVGSYANKRYNTMLKSYKETGNINKSMIIAIDENNVVYNLEKYLETFPPQFKTDLTPKLINVNNTSPSILY